MATYRRSTGSAGSLGAIVSNGTLKGHTTVSTNMGESVSAMQPLRLLMFAVNYRIFCIFSYYNAFANLRSRGTSGSTRSGETSISLSTIISSLSLSTRLSISTL